MGRGTNLVASQPLERAFNREDFGQSRTARVGTAIVSAVVSRLEADGLGWIGLIAERHSEPFYARFGFSPMADATPLVKISS